jgi:hypothetical protein
MMLDCLALSAVAVIDRGGRESAVVTSPGSSSVSAGICGMPCLTGMLRSCWPSAALPLITAPSTGGCSASSPSSPELPGRPRMCSCTSARSPAAATAAWRKGRRPSSTCPRARRAPGGKLQGHRLTHRQGRAPAPRLLAPSSRATAAQRKAAGQHVTRCACRVTCCATRSRQTHRWDRRPRRPAVPGPDAHGPAAGVSASW